MPTISVIISVYNSERYVSETLDCVLAQTFTDFEIICIDDGSTDGSLGILREYEKKDSRIRVLSQENQGVVTARNNAIAEARGEFIYTLDGDDLIHKTTLRKSYDALMGKKGDVITCRVAFFGEQNGEMWLPDPNKIQMARGNCLVNAALFRKSLFDRSGGYDTAFNLGLEDYDFWLNLLYRHDATIYRIPEILFYYRIRPKSRNSEATDNYLSDLMSKLSDKYPDINKYRQQPVPEIKNVSGNFVYSKVENTKETVWKLLGIPFAKMKKRGNGEKIYKCFGIPWFREELTPKGYSSWLFGKLISRKLSVQELIEKRYDDASRKVLAKKQKGRKIRVGLMVTQSDLNGYEGLLRALKDDGGVEPCLLFVSRNDTDLDMSDVLRCFGDYDYSVISELKDFKGQNLDVALYADNSILKNQEFALEKTSRYALIFNLSLIENYKKEELTEKDLLRMKSDFIRLFGNKEER